MKKKVNNNDNNFKFKSPQKCIIKNSMSMTTEFSSIFYKFFESSSKYNLSIKKIINEINIKIVNNNPFCLDEQSIKCLTSLNKTFNYLVASFNQFFLNSKKYFEKINLTKRSKISLSYKKPKLSKKLINSDIGSDNNDSHNIKHVKTENKNLIFNNYLKSKFENNKSMYSKIKSIKYYSIDVGNNKNENDINSFVDLNILDINFIKNIKSLLTILKNEKRKNINNNKNIKNQFKLDNLKERLIFQLSNKLNKGNAKLIAHRRIKSVNTEEISNNTSNIIANINENTFNKNLSDRLIKKKIEKKNLRNNETLDKNKLSSTIENLEPSSFIDNLKLKTISSEKNLNEIDETKNSINLNQIEIMKLQKEVSILENNKKDLLTQIADLITRNNTLTEEISVLNLKIDKIEKEKNILNENINELNIKLELLTNSKNEIEKKHLILKEKMESYENEKSLKLKELNKVLNSLEEMKKENIKLNKNKDDIENEIKLSKKTIRDLNIQIAQLGKENEIINNILNDTNNKKEEFKEKYKKVSKELEEEKEMNLFMDKKVKKLEKKLEEHNIIDFDDTKTKTYKLGLMNKVNEIEVEKLQKKYTSPNNYRKNTSAVSTNNTSNMKLVNNNLVEQELTPENFTIVKFFKLDNLKWFLLKKIKKKSTERGNELSPSQSQSKYRRYRILKMNSKFNNERKDESYSDFIWKSNKNENDFVNFDLNNIDNIDDKNEFSREKQKKINELETCIKDLEEKLEKKENDCNRINLNYAKLFKRTKIPEETYDKLIENVEKLKTENKILKKKIDNFKSTQDFIRISFIEDDLEGSKFIDDKCFEEILDSLVENKSRHNTYKNYKTKKEENNYEINMMKYFKSHVDENKEINEENNNNDANKEDVKEENRDLNNEISPTKYEYKRHFHHKFEGNRNPNCKSAKNINSIKEENITKEKNELNIDVKIENNNKDTIKNDKWTNTRRTYNKKTENKKYFFNRYSKSKHTTNIINKVSNNNTIDNENVNNNEENKDRDKDKEENELRILKSDKDYIKNRYLNKNEKDYPNIDNANYKNKGKRFHHLNTNNYLEKNAERKSIKEFSIVKTENDEEKISNNIFSNKKGFRRTYQRNQEVNNVNIKDNDFKKDENIDNKDGEKFVENKSYKILKTMKIESQNKSERKLELQDSSSKNHAYRGRRFYKKRQENLKSEANV